MHAYLADDGVKVSGFAKRPPLRLGQIMGYIRTVARLTDGQVVAEKYVLAKTIVQRSGKGGTFFVKLRLADPSVIETVEVSYVSEKDFDSSRASNSS
ncbi:MAG: hypothetical protein AB7U35_15840 [Sphingobium sp.]